MFFVLNELEIDAFCCLMTEFMLNCLIIRHLTNLIRFAFFRILDVFSCYEFDCPLYVFRLVLEIELKNRKDGWRFKHIFFGENFEF
ncbi:hypothetical protein CHX27_06305 [Flavobacterium aurantiibacter]|uniref:Uncharacterized protein n=1 Tax=Flavobacterium aurantiibacter TaxID=2023067 RepID=A0A255ZVB6_9FLAO|nr:hypothetical protein CHX27_06305 [Flavobacterium aurantiibacter]